MTTRTFARCPKCTKALPPKLRGGKRTGQQRTSCSTCPGVVPSFVVEVTSVSGGKRQRKQSTFGTRAEAERHVITLEAVEAGLDIPAEPSAEPLADAIGRWVASRSSLASNTRSAYLRVVKLVGGDPVGSRPIGKVTKADLRGLYGRWLDDDQYSVASVRQFSSVVAGAISEAHAEGQIRTNPSHRAFEAPKDAQPTPERQKAWTADQARRFIDDARGDDLYPLWRLLLSTGMRRSEALALEHEDFDLEGGSVRIRGSLVSVKRSGEVEVGRPKSGKSRVAFLDDDTADVMAEHLREQRKDRMRSAHWLDGYDFAFTRGGGLPWNPSTVSMRFKALAERLDLPAVGVHGLRHSAATLLIESGIDVTAVRDHLGHASIDTTVGSYSHRSDAGRREVARALGRVINDG